MLGVCTKLYPGLLDVMVLSHVFVSHFSIKSTVHCANVTEVLKSSYSHPHSQWVYTRKPVVVCQRTPLSRADSAHASEKSSCMQTPQKLGGIEEDILSGNICQLITQLCTHLFFFFWVNCLKKKR